jgi:hypothetical protein
MATGNVANAAAETIDMAFGEVAEDVIGTIKAGHERLYELATLLQTIKQLNESPSPHTNRQISHLASLGWQVAADAANYIDCEREKYHDNLVAAGVVARALRTPEPCSVA